MMAWPLSRSLSQRLSAVFALLLLACCGASAWLQWRSSEQHAQEVIQRLSIGLAAHIAGNAALMQTEGLNEPAVKALFGKLMDVNPSVEVYLLAPDGRIAAQAAPPGHLKRDRVDLGPVRRLLAGEPLPIFGDDPRSESRTKVFSAAPLQVAGSSGAAGYVYVVLLGEEHDALADHIGIDNALHHTLWAMAVVAACGLAAGLLAFHWITRPLRQLTADVQRFEAEGIAAVATATGTHPEPAAPDLAPSHGTNDAPGDELARLRHAFTQMTQRIAQQWQELTRQDQQRRELVANISHDLRTPLTSLHGYLETLRLKADTLSDADRQRYLDVALGQSRKVGRLAQELFELARLEYGVVKPEREDFSLAELVQDVFQKFELAAEARRQQLVPDIAPGLPAVSADLGMIERVLTNLLDNAIRHTPEGGRITVALRREGGGIDVRVSDSGPGIPPALQAHLFTRPSFASGMRGVAGAGGGLGLMIVRRILQLHGSDIRLEPPAGNGAVFRFRLGDTLAAGAGRSADTRRVAGGSRP